MEWFCEGYKILSMTREDAEAMWHLPAGAAYERDEDYWDEEDVEDVKSAFFVWKEDGDRELHGYGEEDEPLPLKEILDFGLKHPDREFVVEKAFMNEACTKTWKYIAKDY